MSEYISTFATGFGKVIRKALPMSLPGVSIISVFDGLIHYRYHGNLSNISRVSYFNNTYYVINKYTGETLSFSSMARGLAKKPLRLLYGKGSFRLRFSRENHFEKVDKQIVSAVEKLICKNSGMMVDRVNPQNEFWFIIRRENVGFFCQLLRKRTITEKNLEKGELRPELAFLIAVYAEVSPADVVCDPFAGHGAIPIQLVKHFGVQSMLINDLDRMCYTALNRIPLFKGVNIRITNEDALVLESVASQSVDAIITDPPWGYYKEIEDIQVFYEKMFKSFRRILKSTGKAIVLSARKDELIQAALGEHIMIVNQLDTLVNGKKAALFYLKL